MHQDAHVRTTPGGTRRSLATGAIRLPPPTPGKQYDPTFPRTPRTGGSSRLTTAQSARLYTAPTPPGSSQPWMSLPGLSEQRSARMYTKNARGINGQLPPLSAPKKPEDAEKEEVEEGEVGQVGEEGEKVEGGEDGVMASPRDDQPDSPMMTAETLDTASATPASAIIRTPRSVHQRMDYERRCWPFNSDTEGMMRQDHREARKKAGALRTDGHTGHVNWGQSGLTSHALNFGLGLGAEPGRMAFAAPPPTAGMFTPSTPGSLRQSTPFLGRSGGILMVPTPNGIETRVIKDVMAPEPKGQEGSEMLVVHHHTMDPEAKLE